MDLLTSIGTTLIHVDILSKVVYILMLMNSMAKGKTKIQTNRNRVYQLVYQTGAISKPEIASRLGVSLPTAIQNVKILQQEGLLIEGEALESTGGRKATAVTFNKNAKFAIGTAIGKNHISFVLINLAAEIIESLRVEREFKNNPVYY